MQDIASEFSKIFRVREGATPSRTQHPARGLWPGAGRKPPPGVGTQTLVPLNFSAGVAPLIFCIPIESLYVTSYV